RPEAHCIVSVGIFGEIERLNYLESRGNSRSLYTRSGKSLAGKLGDYNRNVVFASALIGKLHQLSAGVGQIFGVANNLTHLDIGHLIRETVGAEQHRVAVAKIDARHFDVNARLSAESLKYHVAGHIFGLKARLLNRVGPRLIFSNLLYLIAANYIGARIAYLRYVNGGAVNESRRYSRTHSA